MFNRKSRLLLITGKTTILGLMLSLLIGGFSTIHAAGNQNVYVLGTDINNGLFYKISDNALTTDNATQADCNIYFDTAMNTLYLKDFTYEGSGNFCESGEITVFDLMSDDKINIICEGNNSITLSSTGNKEGQIISAIINRNTDLSIETKENSSLTINVNGENFVEYTQSSAKDEVSAIYAYGESSDLYINADISLNITDTDPEKGASLCGIKAESLKLDKSANLYINCAQAYESFGILTTQNLEIYGAKAVINVAETVANDKRSNAVKCGEDISIEDRTYLDLKSYDNGILAASILISDFDFINVETLGKESKAFDILDRENGSLEIKLDRKLSNFETEYSAGIVDSMKKINSINAKTFENPCVSLKIFTKINVVDFAMPMLGEYSDTDVNCKSDFIEKTNVYWYEHTADGSVEKALIDYPEKTLIEADKQYDVIFEFTPNQNYTPSKNYLLCLIDGRKCEAFVENGKIYAVLHTGVLEKSDVKSDVTKWNIGESEGKVCFTLGGAYTKDILLTVDNKGMDEELYTYKEGKVYVEEELFDKLLKGKHEIRISSFDEEGKLVSTANTDIEINRNVNGNYFWRILAIGAVVLAVVIASMLIKKKNK
ncbi:MAG: hypothetical protein E7242_09410 [Lachnospiraceae bacterium]|nr:hypothetical protein [Lachnospiraceae bacterium]